MYSRPKIHSSRTRVLVFQDSNSDSDTLDLDSTLYDLQLTGLHCN